jgi:hypothetical protein
MKGFTQHSNCGTCRRIKILFADSETVRRVKLSKGTCTPPSCSVHIMSSTATKLFHDELTSQLRLWGMFLEKHAITEFPADHEDT